MSTPQDAGAAVEYRERLWVPVSYWAIGLFFSLTFVTAITFALGDLVLAVAALVTAGGVAGVLLAWGGLAIGVDGRGLKVGSALLEWPYVGAAEVLDAGSARRALADGPGRVFPALRPYLPMAVAVTVTDPADPHRTWLIGTRRPHQLVAAIERARKLAEGGARSGGG